MWSYTARCADHDHVLDRGRHFIEDLIDRFERKRVFKIFMWEWGHLIRYRNKSNESMERIHVQPMYGLGQLTSACGVEHLTSRNARMLLMIALNKSYR